MCTKERKCLAKILKIIFFDRQFRFCSMRLSHSVLFSSISLVSSSTLDKNFFFLMFYRMFVVVDHYCTISTFYFIVVVKLFSTQLVPCHLCAFTKNIKKLISCETQQKIEF